MTTPQEDVKRLLQEMLLEDKCEVCGSTTGIQARVVPGSKTYTSRSPGHLCQKCYDEIASMKKGSTVKSDVPSSTTAKPSVSTVTDQQVISLIGNVKHTINPEGTIDVDGDVNLSSRGLTKIPFKFGKVSGDFNCENNHLTFLQGAPTSVGRGFYCGGNYLTSLQGAPTSVGRNFDCSYNQLTSLQGAPTSVGRNFDCSYNYLTSLQGAPTSVGGDFYYHSNPKLPKSEIDMYRKSGAVKGEISD